MIAEFHTHNLLSPLSSVAVVGVGGVGSVTAEYHPHNVLSPPL